MFIICSLYSEDLDKITTFTWVDFRVLSHLPHLVRLNRTTVRFPSWCGLFGQVRMQQLHSGAHQKRTKQLYRDLFEEVVSVRFQTNPGAVCLW